jgi:hypothetical protein
MGWQVGTNSGEGINIDPTPQTSHKEAQEQQTPVVPNMRGGSPHEHQQIGNLQTRHEPQCEHGRLKYRSGRPTEEYSNLVLSNTKISAQGVQLVSIY